MCGALFLFNKSSTGVGNAAIDKDKYQAVFLTNGQVYFGKLKNISGDYLVLTDIYYLQTNGGGTTDAEATTTETQAQLVKLGNELHGPEDEMQINNQQVLFWENLKTDGKVAEAIEKYQP